jgi:predicted RNA-binding Zn-ribbon protein involved in translation (DUF1610 family)
MAISKLSNNPIVYDCPACGKGDMVYYDFELYGSDRDGNRGEPLTHFTCTVCGHEESMWGDHRP